MSKGFDTIEPLSVEGMKKIEEEEGVGHFTGRVSRSTGEGSVDLAVVLYQLNDEDDKLVKRALKVLIKSCRDEEWEQLVLDLGILQVLSKVMEKKAKNSEIIARCCKLIGKFTEGTDDQKMLVRDSEVLPLVFKHLNNDDDKVVEQALPVLLFMTSSGDESMKQFVIDLGTLSVLPKIMEKKKENTVIITDCCTLISNVITGTEDQKERSLVRDSGVLPLVFKYLSDDNYDLVEEALAVLINMTKGDDCMTQSVLDLGTLSVLPKIMEKMKAHSKIFMSCCTVIGNVMAGTEDQRQAVINNGLLTIIVKTMQTGDIYCQELCSWVLLSFKHSTKAQIDSLMAEKPMPALAAVLTHPDEETIENALKVILKLFSTANPTDVDTLKKEAEEEGVVGHLERLQRHSNKRVRYVARSILSKYFVEGDVEEANEKPEKKDEEETKKVQKRKREVDGDNSEDAKKGNFR